MKTHNITIVYTLGNGYRCHFCQHTWNEEEDFYEATEDQIIDRMSDIAANAEDWLGIHRIYGYEGDADELESKIDKATDQKVKIMKIESSIEKKKSELQTIENWFASLEEQQKANLQKKNTLTTELEQLNSELNQTKGN